VWMFTNLYEVVQSSLKLSGFVAIWWHN